MKHLWFFFRLINLCNNILILYSMRLTQVSIYCFIPFLSPIGDCYKYHHFPIYHCDLNVLDKPGYKKGSFAISTSLSIGVSWLISQQSSVNIIHYAALVKPYWSVLCVVFAIMTAINLMKPIIKYICQCSGFFCGDTIRFSTYFNWCSIIVVSCFFGDQTTLACTMVC